MAIKVSNSLTVPFAKLKAQKARYELRGSSTKITLIVETFQMANIPACILLALSCLVPVASCTPAPNQPQELAGKPEGQAQSASKDSRIQDNRIAIRDIEGCSRDETTFYGGEVLSFRQSAKSTEIVVRTEWETTEKLTQLNDEHPIKFLLQGRPIKITELKEIKSALAAHERTVQATVWVCKEKGKDIIKIVDWTPPTK